MTVGRMSAVALLFATLGMAQGAVGQGVSDKAQMAFHEVSTTE